MPEAIRKGAEQARKSLTEIAIVDGTIPFAAIGCHGSSRVLMYPGRKGKGIIAGGAVRVIVELAGISDIVCKVHGTKNFHNVIRATMDGLTQMIRSPSMPFRTSRLRFCSSMARNVRWAKFDSPETQSDWATRENARVVRALGLRRIRHSVVKKDTNCIRGMINKAIHLLEYELVLENDKDARGAS